MKLRIVWLFPVTIFFNLLFGQVVTTSPVFATDDDNITIFFDASKGDAGLKGYTGKVFAHTGVTINGQIWQNVIGNWGQDNVQPELTRDDTNPDLYKLEIGNPHTFYGVSSSTAITQLSFVFRSEGSDGPTGRDAGGADIFVDLHEVGLNAKFASPSSPEFILSGTSLNIKAFGSGADSLVLFIDGVSVKSVTTDTLEHSHQFYETGKKDLIIKAFGGSEIVSDSTYVLVRSGTNIAALPSGIEYGINYVDATTVTLALPSPGKKFVYLIGDFSNWEADENHQMNITPDSSTHWISLQNLEPGKEYAYQYFIEGTLKLADPYADKILDPWNDKFITNSTYPDLKDYPSDKTSGIVSVFQTNQIAYAWEVTDFVKPDKEDLVIYELLVRDFVSEHDYKTLIDSLDYFSRLGINAIELLPVNEFEGNSSWGYNPSFLFAPDKYYGPKNDLKRFIDECHKRGIAVIMDLVLNHQFGLSPFVQMYFENGKPAADNPWFNVDHNFKNTEAHWGYDFDHESLATQQLVDRVTKYWLTEYKFDGFRFDFTKGIGNNWKSDSDPWASLYDADRVRLLKRMVDKIRATDPDAIISFEHLAENKEEKELADYGILLWGNMNHNYNEASMGYNSDNKSDLSGALYTSRGWTNPNLISYMESHDEERLMVKNIKYGNSSGDYNIKTLETALARQMLVSAFFYTIPGPKMLWQFGELGYDFSIDYNGRLGEKPIRWDYYQDTDRRNLYKVTSELIKLKTKYDVFRTRDISYSLNSASKRLNLTTDSLKATIIGNFDVKVASVSPNFQVEGWWYDYFSGDSIYVSDTNAAMELTAGEFHIYTNQKLETPEQGIIVDVQELTDNLIESYGLAQNYPNPFNPSTTFKYQIPEESKVTIRIYNSLGEVVKTLINKTQHRGSYKVIWDGTNSQGGKVASGVYFYQLIANDFSQTKKMLLVK